MARPMRLMITVYRDRHVTKPIKMVWPVEDPTITTIEQLLDEISYELDFDPYATVQLNGFDCAHYHHVSALLRDGDELVIQAKQSRDSTPPRKRLRLDSESARELSPGHRLNTASAGAQPVETQAEFDAELLAMAGGDSSDEAAHNDTIGARSTLHDADSNFHSESESSSQSESDSEPDSEPDRSDDSDSSSDPSSDSERSSRSHYESSDASSSSSEALTKSRSDGKPVVNGTSSNGFGIPHQGQNKTKTRNRRRRQSRKLAQLKEDGALPQDASFADLEAYEAGEYDLTARKQALLDSIAGNGIDIAVNSFGKRPPSVNDEGPEVISSKRARTSPAPASKPRQRLDLQSSNRLIFGSLGVKPPQTKSDKDNLREKLNGKQTKNVKQMDHKSSETILQPNDTVKWEDKLNLSAVECIDENVELSIPPFPFKQRWDPQYAKSKKSRSKPLNYDDVPSAEEFDEHADADDQDYPPWPDLPETPEDITVLPALHQPQVEDVFVIRAMTCEASNGYQPQWKNRTGQVLFVEGDDVEIRYRVAEPGVDENGDHIHSKFEIPEAYDDGFREVRWTEDMEGARLLWRENVNQVT